jgi:hypothetical protein
MSNAYVDTTQLVNMGIHQIWCFPVMINGETIGALNISGRKDGYKQETVKEFKSIAEEDAKAAFEAYFKREGRPQ